MTSLPSQKDSISGLDQPVIWLHPRAWPADNRTRKYITLTERHHSRETDLGILRRTVETLLRQQDERGSFYTDEEYLKGDKMDDQVGAAAALAYFIAQTEAKPELVAALEKAVRFHLDHHVWKSPSRPFRYTRSVPDRDEKDDWCCQLWCLGAATHILKHGAPFLTEKTSADLRELLADYWGILSTFSLRDEQPCHNQRLAYCELGIAYAKTVRDEKIVAELLEYYHRKLRPLRIWDRGHWIFSEFNQWDVHYGGLSWLMLEHLAAATGDPVIAEDAQEQAFYFNERISAGGYAWGGPRNNECGSDEFPHLFVSRAAELGLDRLLLPEPSNLWPRLAMDGHYGGALASRMEISLPQRKPRTLAPTPWHFRKLGVSVCLEDDFKVHLISASGLELIPAANAMGAGSCLVWLKDGVWKTDQMQKHPPRASEGLRFCDALPVHLRKLTGLASMQRGYAWETRQWWLTSGDQLLWVIQLVTHGLPSWDRLEYLVGNPVITRVANRAVPVVSAKSAEGAEIDTQGDAASVFSRKFISFGEVKIGATLPMEFNRPSRNAFHTFPCKGLWRDCTSSNELRLKIFEGPGRSESRESTFFAIEIGTDTPSLAITSDPENGTVKSQLGTFRARQTDGIWSYAFESTAGEEELPYPRFRSRP